ncbi:hypothetical protein AN641_06580 [Candidatus Epulonipiscioides gigas]|nr:hypothetical protein AN641_06580 [Epulopiscium sp. SCG-C07WGA-EpuloA2]
MKVIPIYLFLLLLLPSLIFADNNMSYGKILTSNFGITNAQYAIMQNGKIILSNISGENYGYLFDVNTLFPIASISKMYTTASIMLLVDRNQIILDAPITKYIPDFQMRDTRYKDITVRMLLNHSSGLLGGSVSNSLLYGESSPQVMDELLDRLSLERLKADPGKFSVYCNDGYALLELLIENITNMSFTEFLYINFFEPLELLHTKTTAQDLSNINVVKADKGLYKGKMSLYVEEIFNYIGVGGVLASAQDVCKFMNVFIDEGILSRHSIETTKYPEYLRGIWHNDPNSNVAFGLGWDNVNLDPFYDQGLQILVKNGDLLGSHSTVLVAPEIDTIICVLTTGGNSLYTQIVATQMLVDMLSQKGQEFDIKTISNNTSFPIKICPEMPAELMLFNGIYANFYTDYTVEIFANGVLTITQNQTQLPPQKFYYQCDNEFKTMDGFCTVTFVRESNDKIYLQTKAIIDVGLVPIWQSQYELVKLLPSITLPQYEQAWHKRFGMEYFLVNENYSSLLYTAQPILKIPHNSNLLGYIGHYKIIDQYNALNVVQIPQNNGRDIIDIYIEEIEGVEYAHSQGNIFISSKNIPILSNNTIQINKNGFSQWFYISQEDKTKIIDVKAYGKGMFSIYNHFGECIYNSHLESEKSVALKDAEKIVFAGEPHSYFIIKKTIAS